MGSTLEHIGVGDNFLYRTPMSQAVRSTIDKWVLIKQRSVWKAKDTVNRTKWQSTYWERIFTNPTSDRGQEEEGWDEELWEGVLGSGKKLF